MGNVDMGAGLGHVARECAGPVSDVTESDPGDFAVVGEHAHGG